MLPIRHPAMTLSALAAAAAVGLLQGALVALPRGDALGSLRRLRSPVWAAVLPGAIVVGTFAPRGAPRFALGLIVLATLATPPLAAIATLAVVRGPRVGLLALAIGAALLATLVGGWGSEVSTTVLTALGALALGSALARLIPGGWVLVGFACMCALDAGLILAGVGQSAAADITRAAANVHVPVFDHAHIGGIVVDYPDLVLAAVLGGFLAGKPGQWQAAALVTVLVAASLLLTPVNSMFPATIPTVVALLAVRAGGLLRRAQDESLAPQPAAP